MAKPSTALSSEAEQVLGLTNDQLANVDNAVSDREKHADMSE